MVLRMLTRVCSFCGRPKIYSPPPRTQLLRRCSSRPEQMVEAEMRPGNQVEESDTRVQESESFLEEKTVSHTKKQQPHWLLNSKTWTGKLTLADILHDNIVYQNKNLIAINKPHNLPMQASSEPLTVLSVLPKLRKRLDLDYLEVGVSLDRLHSGVIVLCKTPEMKARLQKHMLTSRSQKQPFKTYWAITMGIPRDSEGDESLALGQVKVGGYYMSETLEKYSQSSIKKGSVIKPSMKYKVLSTSNEYQVSLVQLQPTSTKWDFLQVYLTQQMCSVLGDHMYSSRVKSILGKTVLVDPTHAPPRPQTLPEDLRAILQVSKEYQEWIPLHLHCVSLQVPYSDKFKRRTVRISAPAPDYFQQTAQLLGLEMPVLRRDQSKSPTDILSV